LYNDLPGLQQAVLRRLMLRLVGFDGRELVRRRAPRAELLDFDGPERARVEAVLEKLEESRLVTSDTMASPVNPAREEASIEVSHEALLHGWVELGKWVEAEQASAENQGLSIPQRRRLTEDAVRWRAETNRGRRRYTWANSPALPAAERELARDALAF